MPKRSEKRDTAKAEYIAKKKKGEEVSLRALAGELGVSYQTMRNWKAADKWEEALPKKKRGGQPGNQNSKGKRNAAGSHDGAPPGNKNAEKDGAYSTVFFETQEELPRHGKKKHKYKKVKKNKSASRAPAGESIEQRPEEIDEREEFGHWEGDTVYSGKGKRKTTRALLTLTERKTRKEIIIAIPNRKAETVVKALDALERKLGARRFRAIFKSITFDNGTEFAAAEELERSCVNKHLPRTKVYFCHPYSSWERGTNENTNGMIRRRFPKGTNFAAVTNAQIVQAENWINNYPRKILGYKSSEIVFRECLRELGIAA